MNMSSLTLTSALEQIRRETIGEWKSKLDDITEKHVQLKEQMAFSLKRCEHCTEFLEQNRILVEDFKNQMKKNNDTFEHIEKILQYVMCSFGEKEHKESGESHRKLTKTGSHPYKRQEIAGRDSIVVAPQGKKDYTESKVLCKLRVSLIRNRDVATNFETQNEVANSAENNVEDRSMGCNTGLLAMPETLGLNSVKDEEMSNGDVTSFKTKTEFLTQSDVKIEETSHDEIQTPLSRSRFLDESNNNRDGEAQSTYRYVKDLNFAQESEHIQHDNRSLNSKHDAFKYAWGVSTSSEVSNFDKNKTRMGHGRNISVHLPIPTNNNKKDTDCQSDKQEDNSQITHNSISIEEFGQQGEQFDVSSREEQNIHKHDSQKGEKHAFTDWLNTQWQIVAGEKPYKCEICGEGFTFSQMLRKHKQAHDPIREKRYKCDVCGKGFPAPSVLSKHKRVHTGEKPCICDICGRGYSHPSSLGVHKLTHSTEKPHKCEVCGKGFHQARYLHYHKDVHKPSGERAFQCDHCGKGFGVYWTLLIHKRTHTGEQPYVCDVCGKGFRYGGSFKSHMQTHTEKGKGVEMPCESDETFELFSQTGGPKNTHE